MQNLLTKNKPEFTFVSAVPRLSNGENPPSGNQLLACKNSLETLIVDEHVIPLLLAGKFNEYLQSVELISPEIREKHPKILIYQATAMLFSEYSHERIEQILVEVEQLDHSGAFAGEILAIRGILESYTGDPERGIALSQKAFSRIKKSNTFFRNLVERNLGIAFTLEGDLINANTWLEKCLMSSFAMQDWVGVLAAYNYLTFVRRIQGRLKEADVIYKKALAFIESHQLAKLPHSIKIISGYGALLLQWHRIEEAKFYILKAIHLAKESDSHYAFTAYQNLCEVYLRENDAQNAISVIDQLLELFAEGNDLYEKIHFRSTQAMQARVNLELGKVEHAYDWLIKSNIDQSTPNDLHKQFGYKLGYILPIAAQIYTTIGQPDQAIKELNAIIPKFLLQGANAYLIRALCALAIAFDQKGQKQKAQETLKKAINFAIKEDNLGDFVFLGQSLKPLVKALYKSGYTPEFTLKLVKILDNLSPHYQNRCNQTEQLCKLSRRELDVLELLAKGMTNQEIAQSLFLSTNTIKSHSIKIYRKLDVKNRNQAVNKARTMGILAIQSQVIEHGFQAIP